jgi:hypothetical protein
MLIYLYYRSIAKPDDLRNVVLCALLLSEWLKELAAITQEHAVSILKQILFS